MDSRFFFFYFGPYFWHQELPDLFMHGTSHTSSVSVSGHLCCLSLLIETSITRVYSRQLDSRKHLETGHLS